MEDHNHVTPELLGKIDAVNRACHALHVPAPPVIFVTAEVFGPDGTLEKRYHEQARSWTRNFYNMLASSFLPCGVVDPGSIGFGAGSLRIKTPAGSIKAAAPTYPICIQPYAISTTMIGGDNANYGLFVGTGTREVSFEDYALQSKIIKGVGSGQMNWSNEYDTLPIYDSEEKKWTHSWRRDFTNNSGETITIGETGLYYWLYYSGSSNRDYFMVERNVPKTPYVVEDGRTCRVTYTTEMTFPA